MNLQEIIDELKLEVLTKPQDFTAVFPQGGYSSDLLSCVMAGASRAGIWVTLQAHGNVVAVAALLDLAAVIITENARPDEATLLRANTEGITLLATTEPTFTVIGKLWELGLRAGSHVGGAEI
jgi:imidazolonepropionase-like amidohydrolase